MTRDVVVIETAACHRPAVMQIVVHIRVHIPAVTFQQHSSSCCSVMVVRLAVKQAAPSDIIFGLVKLPVVVLRGSGVSPDTPVTSQAALETPPLPGNRLLLLIMSNSCSRSLGPLPSANITCIRHSIMTLCIRSARLL